MQKRFASIWFRYLATDWFTRRRPALKKVPFVLVAPDHGRMVITAANTCALEKEIGTGILLADAKAIIPSLIYFDDKPSLPFKLLSGIAEWCIRYTPFAAIDLPDGLMLDITGCTHLWGSEEQYLTDMCKRLNDFGYHTGIAIADTVGAAWALARYGKNKSIVETGQHAAALLSLPPSALRIDPATIERLQKLGLSRIGSFSNMPRTALRSRFGEHFLKRLDQALGSEEEIILPIQPVIPYCERLPCLEPIITLKGIEIALQKLLGTMCARFKHEEKGLRNAVFKCYRVDGKIQTIEIGTHRPSANSIHLFKLFENKIETIEPALGIELFTFQALKVEALSPMQEKLWDRSAGWDDMGLSQLLDRISGKFGDKCIHRYLPCEHSWPEYSFISASSITEKIQTAWKAGRPRPLQLLSKPEPIEVTAPVPDYPPMLFRFKGKLHKITKADGPERIEPEWWLQEEKHRDYYYVEDEEGHRYWLFRSGHYDNAKSWQWFIHGFFA
jgi:protein ImuB